MRTSACLFAFAVLLSAWQPPGGAIGPVRQTPTGTDCAADGYVVNAITGEPIPRARIFASSASANGTSANGPGGSGGTPTSVTADSSGHWRFPSLACGPIHLTAVRQGFLSAPPPPAAITLASGSPAHDIAIRLTPTAVITGKVVDDQGDPVPNMQIILLASRVADGRRTFVLTGTATGNSSTNDLGEFRLAGLSAGKYIVCAEPNVRGGGDPVTYGESCYPGSFENGAASALDVASGGEMRADIAVHEVPPVHVRGVMTGMPKAQGVALTLNRRSINLPTGARAAKVSPDGKFDVAGVSPGSYVLSTDYFEAGARLHARVPVEVGNADVNEVTVHLDSGFTIAGKVRIESKSNEAPAQKIVVALRSAEPMSGGGPTQWNADHSAFTIGDLTPGNYRLDVVIGGKLFVKNATLAGRDIIGQEIPLVESSGPLDIVLSDDGGALDVRVTGADDQPAQGSGVMILRNGSQPQTAIAGPDGRATLQGLAPGDYQVYAWDDVRQVEYANPDWIGRYGAGGHLVSVQAGQFPQVTVKQQLVPAR